MIPHSAFCLAFLQVALGNEPIHFYAQQQASPMKFPDVDLIDGCYYKHARYESPFAHKTNASTIHECQQKCVESVGLKCFFFGFHPFSGACHLAPADAAFAPYSHDFYAGPKVCPEQPVVCTDVPTPAFPAADAEMSKMAWPVHMVPAKLGCWPKDYVGKKFMACPRVTVVEDTNTGWPGLCEGLKEVVVPYQETCQSWCEKKASCSVWQEVQKENSLEKVCYQTFWSPGVDCYTTRLFKNGTEDFGFKPLRAQRLMRGEVRVLKKLSFVHIDGLKRVFNENYFAKQEDAVKACQTICYSDLGCQWWIYNRLQGCFVEDISHQRLPVPMTTQTFRVFASEAAEVLDGEYIQHQCKEIPYSAVSSPEVIPEFQKETTAAPATTTTTTPFTTTTQGTTKGLQILTPSPEILHSEILHQGQRVSSQKIDPNDLKLLGVGALVVKGIDLNLIDITMRSKLSRRYAELIAANTRLSRDDVLDLNNKVGDVTLESWQTGNPVIRKLQRLRRLQTAEPGFKAAFKLSEKGGETYSQASAVLTSDRFYTEVQHETAAMLKHTPVGGTLPNVQAIIRPAQDSDLLPANAERKQGGSNANAELWLFILGFILLALIIGLILWLFSGSGMTKKVSFTRKAETKEGQFRKLEDQELEYGEGGKISRASKKNGVGQAASPSRKEIQEAEMRAVQVASRLSEEVDDDEVPQAWQGYGSGSRIAPTPQVGLGGNPYVTPTPYTGQYQMPSLTPGYAGPRVIR